MSRHSRVDGWPPGIRTHLPHLSKPQTTDRPHGSAGEWKRCSK
jgi:hypothetical protein